MKGFAILLGAAVVAGIVFMIAVGVGHVTQPAAFAALKTPWTGQYSAQEMIRSSTYIDVLPVKGSEHVPMANFAVSPGVPVTLTIRNYTRESHTFVARSLGLDVKIAPGSAGTPTVTRFTFVAPFGVFAWHCRDCPGTMQGKIYSIVGARSAQTA
jgi:hypothetical protein